MNVNGIMLGLETITSLEVEQDYYEGNNEEWITFTYADERYQDYGNDTPYSEYCSMQIKVVLKKNTDYFQMKEDIKSYLLQNGAYDIGTQAYMDPTDDKNKFRILIVTCKFIKTK